MRTKFSLMVIFLAFVMTLSCLICSSKIKVFAKEEEQAFSQSKSAYIVEPFSNTVIYKKDEDKKLPIASMCKIMTLLICFEAIDNEDLSYDELIKVSEKASGMGGSQIFLETNGEYTVGELLKGIVVASANDACVALAERLCGNEELFVKRMNERAEELGMSNTLFANCTGLPKIEQYCSAKDVSIMFSELLKHHDYFRFAKIWTDKVVHPNDRITEISNTNKLIRFYEGCDCGKTGYTSEAGHCLVASACRNGMRIVSVVIGASDSKTRFKEVSDMFNYAFANYTNKKIVDESIPLEIKVDVVGGKKDTLEVIPAEPVFIFSKKNEKRCFEINFYPEAKVKAPIEKGDKVGRLTIYENGVEIKSVNVLANEDVFNKTYYESYSPLTQSGSKFSPSSFSSTQSGLKFPTILKYV